MEAGPRRHDYTAARPSPTTVMLYPRSVTMCNHVMTNARLHMTYMVRAAPIVEGVAAATAVVVAAAMAAMVATACPPPPPPLGGNTASVHKAAYPTACNLLTLADTLLPPHLHYTATGSHRDCRKRQDRRLHAVLPVLGRIAKPSRLAK